MKEQNFSPIEFNLDDKELLAEFYNARMDAKKVKDFAYNLLKGRFLSEVQKNRDGNPLLQFQTLLGTMGPGKTFTMDNIIVTLNKPTIVIACNKTLAGQL